MGVLFVVISNIFQIIPASLVRHALDLMSESYDLLYFYRGTETSSLFEDSFIASTLLYGVIILLMVILRGIFLFFTRQTIIVVSENTPFTLTAVDPGLCAAGVQYIHYEIWWQNETGGSTPLRPNPTACHSSSRPSPRRRSWSRIGRRT